MTTERKLSAISKTLFSPKDKEYLEQTVKVSILSLIHILQELINVVAGNFEIGLAIIIN